MDKLTEAGIAIIIVLLGLRIMSIDVARGDQMPLWIVIAFVVFWIVIAFVVLLLANRLFWFLLNKSRERTLPPCPPLSGFRVDLATYHCCEMTIGEPLQAVNAFFPDLYPEKTVKDEKQGFEIGLKSAVLDYAFIDLQHFPGLITRKGEPMPYLRFWDAQRVAAELGEPYWREEDDKEVILFYEDRYVETQIEFPDKKTARYITILCNPILADAATRKFYHCHKPWPS